MSNTVNAKVDTHEDDIDIRSPYVPTAVDRSSSYIHMNDSQSQYEQLPHARMDSGYTHSTLGSSVPPMHTIGVRRGADLLRSRTQGTAIDLNMGDAGLSDGRTMPRFEELQPGQGVNVSIDTDEPSDLGIPEYFQSRDLNRNLAGGDSTIASEMISKDREFYLLQGKESSAGHVLSAEALAGELNVRAFLSSALSRNTRKAEV